MPEETPKQALINTEKNIIFEEQVKGDRPTKFHSTTKKDKKTTKRRKKLLF